MMDEVAWSEKQLATRQATRTRIIIRYRHKKPGNCRRARSLMGGKATLVLLVAYVLRAPGGTNHLPARTSLPIALVIPPSRPAALLVLSRVAPHLQPAELKALLPAAWRALAASPSTSPAHNILADPCQLARPAPLASQPAREPALGAPFYSGLAAPAPAPPPPLRCTCHLAAASSPLAAAFQFAGTVPLLTCGQAAVPAGSDAARPSGGGLLARARTDAMQAAPCLYCRLHATGRRHPSAAPTATAPDASPFATLLMRPPGEAVTSAGRSITGPSGTLASRQYAHGVYPPSAAESAPMTVAAVAVLPPPSEHAYTTVRAASLRTGALEVCQPACRPAERPPPQSANLSRATSEDVVSVDIGTHNGEVAIENQGGQKRHRTTTPLHFLAVTYTVRFFSALPLTQGGPLEPNGFLPAPVVPANPFGGGALRAQVSLASALVFIFGAEAHPHIVKTLVCEQFYRFEPLLLVARPTAQ